METKDLTYTLVVDQSPEQVFKAITNVRGWWSEEIEGDTEKLNDEFTYHFEDVHYCQIKLIEVIPNEKVVWLVKYNYFKFTKDKSEWTGTKVSFDISKKDNKTQIKFTHIGLVPEYECYEICSNAWGNYINNSLYSLISTGKGLPNAGGKPRTDDEKKFAEANQSMHDYHISLIVDLTAHDVFKTINQVTAWWTDDLQGDSQKLNDEFTVRFDEIHVSTQKIVELIPDKKIVWLVTDSKLNFIQKEDEWTGTSIRFELTEQGHQTRLDFTHFGLVPEVECYNACVGGWDHFIKGSLFKLLTEGKGTPGLM